MMPEHDGSLAAAQDDFLKRWPAYATTSRLDVLRATELARLDAQGHVYLDHTGGGLYGVSQVRRHLALLEEGVYGNPHSSNPTSMASTVAVERCRSRVLEWFRADPDEYVAIFTANASHALKLVGESYPFERGDRFLLTFDNHNSVNGIREFDRTRGATTTYVPLLLPDLRVDEGELDRGLSEGRPGGHNLFAYPAQSNFSGVQHPLGFIERAQRQGWDVLLDAAAFVPSNRLDLSRWHPDFVALSFYKMFGYPTGMGALIGRREALAKLHRPWFAGGTITAASVRADRHAMASGAAAFEDGTIDYVSIPAVEIGLAFLAEVGLDAIHTRVQALTGWLLEQLTDLHHQNGRPLVVVYGPRTTVARGGTIAINLADEQGRVLDHRVVEERANERRISLRTGCFCNPGAGESALGISGEKIAPCFRRGDATMTTDDFRRCIDEKSTGAVRVSLGWSSSFADAHAFVELLRTFLR